MAPLPQQLTFDFITLERELVRLRREFGQFRRNIETARTYAESPAARIASMRLPVGQWEEMEREIRSGRAE